MITVAFDDSPLNSGHAGRGVGVYTRLLQAHLISNPNVQLVSLNKENLKTADLVHYPYFDLFFPTLPIFKRKPTVITIHDVIPLLFPDQYRPGKKGTLSHLKQKIALSNVKAVITDSQASKNDISTHLGVQPEKIHVVYLAADPTLVAGDESDQNRVRRKYKLPQEYILYVGDINYNKNLPQLIKSLKFMPDQVKLVCVGRNFRSQNIPEWHAIESQMILSDVIDRIHFVTDVETGKNNDLGAIYSASLCYVQPSLAEGFGLPVIEALQCRTPVVSAHNSSLVEVGGKVAVFTETTAESIAGGVKEVLAWSKNQRLSKVREGYAWSQTFSWEKAAKETFSVYQACL